MNSMKTLEHAGQVKYLIEVVEVNNIKYLYLKILVWFVVEGSIIHKNLSRNFVYPW